MIDRRHLPWLIAAIVPVVVVLWWRDDTPPPQPESEPPRSTHRIPQGLEPIPPMSAQAPRPPDYYPSWRGDAQVGRLTPSAPPVEAYRFRPLSERERRRIDQQSAGTFGAPQPPARYPVPADDWRRPYAPQPPRDLDRDPMLPEPWQGGWGTEGYSFRPSTPSPQSRERWRGPYREPRVQRPYPPDQLQPFGEGMQWGATPARPVPPSHRMYPALDQPEATSLTAL